MRQLKRMLNNLNQLGRVAAEATNPWAQLEVARTRRSRVTLKERLEQLVRAAPPGTLVPVEGLAKLIDGAEEEVGDLAVEEVGRLAAEKFGRKSAYTPAAIRKWIRSGLRGVRLHAYPSGSGYRVRQRDFEQFVAAVRAQRVDGVEPTLHVADGVDAELEEELRFGQRAYAASSR